MTLAVEELRQLAADVESDRVERKRSLAEPERVREAICAFANDLPGHGKPGYLLIGVEDDGSTGRLDVTDELLRKLADMRSDGNILPMPLMSVERLEIEPGAFVAVVEVLPASAPPVRLRGRVHVRVGPRRAIATVEEERRLTEKQVDGVLTFDQRPCRPATLDDVDLDGFRKQYLPRVVAADVLAENLRSPEDQLASLRLVDPRSGAPTFAGILTVGKDPLRWLPGAYVQFVRFEGPDRASPIRAHERALGNLLEQLPKMELVLRVWIQVAIVPTAGLQNAQSPDYPLAALRELVVNAITHREYDGGNAPVYVYWFSDRVEVMSPGGLYGAVSPENFGRHTSYRNPTLAEAMKALQYSERFGVGIQKVHRELEHNGNPPPRFEFSPTSVLATVYPRPDPFRQPPPPALELPEKP
ncbi:MAG: putative DNA binding domain-containing protein [Deltaproteobacteria bacterium]|nr:putative DNA binding domain-containing protein [Deltaproteobacteria bacterium]